MGWKKHAAGISGATLGYIGGNLPGAIEGYYAGRRLHDWSVGPPPSSVMAPVKRKAAQKKGHNKKHRLGIGRQTTPWINKNTAGGLRPKAKAVSKRKHVKKTDAPKRVQMQTVHSGVSESTLRIGRKKLKLLKHQSTLGRWRYQQTHNAVLAAGTGVQTANAFVFNGTAAQMITSSGTAYSNQQNCTALESLNPYLTNTGSALLGSTVTPLEDRFVYLRHMYEVEISNFTSAACVVDIYLCKCRKTSGQDPVQTWTAGYLSEAFGMSLFAAPVSANPQVLGTQGYLNATYPHAKPTDSPLFRKFWSIEAVRHVVLAGAANEIVNFDIEMNKVIKRDEQQIYATQATQFIANQTYCIMTVVRGCVIEDKTNVADLKAVYAATKVGAAVISKAVACAVKGNASRLNTNLAITNIPAGAALGNTSMINDQDAAANEVATT